MAAIAVEQQVETHPQIGRHLARATPQHVAFVDEGHDPHLALTGGADEGIGFPDFPEVEYAKPTRLFSHIPGIRAFGKCGWPVLDADHHSRGPLPRSCGHNHKTKMIGRDEKT